MPYRTRAEKIIDDWRAVQRALDASTEPAERRRLQIDAELLRRDHQEAVERAEAAGTAEPSPFPETAPATAD